MVTVMNFLFIAFLAIAAPLCHSQELFRAEGDTVYSLTYWEAFQKCADLGASLATPAELYAAYDNGLSTCTCGWLADKTSRYPTHDSDPGCGGSPGVHTCNWQDRYDAYCVKDNVTGNCSRPLGMQSGEIPDAALTASSTYHTFWTERWSPRLARLNRAGLVNGWMPHDDGRNQYIQVDLETPTAVTGVMTQGVSRYFGHQFVSSFKVAYSKDGDLWLFYSRGQDAEIFPGNGDNDGLVRNMFDPPILGQYIRIYPHTWYHHISLRLELFGCDVDEFQAGQRRQRESKVLLS